MENRKKEADKRQRLRYFLLGIAFLVTILCIGTGSAQGRDRVQVGDVATKRYVAPKDTVDMAATRKLQEAAENSVGPIYKTDTAIQEKNMAQVEELFGELDSILNTMEEGESFPEAVRAASLKLPVVLRDRQLLGYEKLSVEERGSFAQGCINVLQKAYDGGITADKLEDIRKKIQGDIAESPWSPILKEMAGMILAAAVEPNQILDENAMEKAKEAKRADVEEVRIRKNQKIVDEGEIITEEIYDRLVTLHLVRSGNFKGSILPILGSLAVTSLLFFAIYLFFRWGRKKRKNAVVLKQNEVKMLFTVYVIMLLLMRILKPFPLFLAMPSGLFAMLVSILIGRRMALWLNTLFCILGCFICNDSVELLLYTLITGILAALLIQKAEKRAYQIPVGLGIAAVDFVTAVSLGLLFTEEYSLALVVQSGIRGLLGLLSVFLVMGSLPFWENIFEANTPLRLVELTNPNHELLRRLLIEAPGTYHHSLIVANLAETAVYEIGGNVALARAGAYYHDVGKLYSPFHFAENQNGQNVHDTLPPEESAKFITQHTRMGVDLAREYGLPQVIQDVILEHHGTGIVKYFYFKALKQYGAEKVDEGDYRYKGRVPTSRESAVIMLADTVEAAVRSMLGNGKTFAEAEEAVKGLMKDKLDDGQLNQSGLRIDELEVIREAFLTVFHGMYHERVAYPDKEEIQAAKEKGQEKEEKQEEQANDSTH